MTAIYIREREMGRVMPFIAGVLSLVAVAVFQAQDARNGAATATFVAAVPIQTESLAN